MGRFQVRYDSRVLIYESKLFIRLATGLVGPLKSALEAVAMISWLLNNLSPSLAVWPDLVKYRHFGQKFEAFGNFWKVDLVLG